MHTEDVIIIGGSYAGISAAMPLARARRRVTLFDAGLRRNRFTRAAHGFITNDGRDPADIHQRAKAELLAYPTVTWVDATVSEVRPGFEVNGVRGKRLILATGVRDELPTIEGLAERWGKSVFVCPYCDGYEQQMGKLAVIGVNEHSLKQLKMLEDWGIPTLVPQSEIARITDRATIVTNDGRSLPFDAIFTAVTMHQASPFAEQLGCAFDDGPQGKTVRVDATQATTVPHVFAAGDAARAMSNVPIAVGDGFRAGVAAHHSLLFP